MKIISLKYQKVKRVESFLVGFDDGTTITLDPELVVKWGIRQGVDISDGQRQEVEASQERLTARRRLVRHLSLRRKTTRECERYLRQLGFSDSAIESAVIGARELGMLDDQAYAEAFVRTQDRSAKKGPRALRQELRARGVDKEIVEAATAEIGLPEMQRARVRELATRKLVSLRNEDAKAKKRKLHDYLVRRGFDTDVVLDAIRELLQSALDDD